MHVLGYNERSLLVIECSHSGFSEVRNQPTIRWTPPKSHHIHCSWAICYWRLRLLDKRTLGYGFRKSREQGFLQSPSPSDLRSSKRHPWRKFSSGSYYTLWNIRVAWAARRSWSVSVATLPTLLKIPPKCGEYKRLRRHIVAQRPVYVAWLRGEWAGFWLWPSRPYIRRACWSGWRVRSLRLQKAEQVKWRSTKRW